jgi:hypothetical protein
MDYLEFKKAFVDKVCISTNQIHAQFSVLMIIILQGG